MTKTITLLAILLVLALTGCDEEQEKIPIICKDAQTTKIPNTLNQQDAKKYVLPEPWEVLYNPDLKIYRIGWFSTFWKKQNFLSRFHGEKEFVDKGELDYDEPIDFADSIEAKQAFIKWVITEPGNFQPIKQKP